MSGMYHLLQGHMLLAIGLLFQAFDDHGLKKKKI